MHNLWNKIAQYVPCTIHEVNLAIVGHPSRLLYETAYIAVAAFDSRINYFSLAIIIFTPRFRAEGTSGPHRIEIMPMDRSIDPKSFR